MRRLLPAALALIAVLAGLACDRVTPVAPVGATITLSINPTRIDARGESATITAIVRREDGTPVNPGTQVNFSTSLGVIDPEIAFTDETGVAKSTLAGDGRIGMAAVAATTGAAAAVEVMVQIGSVAASITLTATPSDVPRDPLPDEGVIELTALIRDDTGAPLAGIVVNFRAEIGTLESRGGPVVTDTLGRARDTLTVSRGNISVLLEPFFEIRAQTAIEGGSLIEDFVEILVSGVPAALTLQATPSVVAEEGGTVTLSALVVDGGGFPLVGSRVTFLTDLGTLGQGTVVTDADGRSIDTLSVTQADITSLGGALTFNVSAQVAGLGGSVVEDTFQMRRTSCRPSASFSCTLTAGLEYQFTYAGLDPAQLTFLWTFQNATSGVAEGSAAVPNPLFTFASGGSKNVTLVVTDPSPGCGVSNSRSIVLNAGVDLGCPP